MIAKKNAKYALATCLLLFLLPGAFSTTHCEVNTVTDNDTDGAVMEVRIKNDVAYSVELPLEVALSMNEDKTAYVGTVDVGAKGVLEKGNALSVSFKKDIVLKGENYQSLLNASGKAVEKKVYCDEEYARVYFRTSSEELTKQVGGTEYVVPSCVLGNKDAVHVPEGSFSWGVPVSNISCPDQYETLVSFVITVEDEAELVENASVSFLPVL